MGTLERRLRALEDKGKDEALHVRTTHAIEQRLQEMREEATAAGIQWPEPDEEARAQVKALLAMGRRTVWVSEEDEKL